MSRVVWCQNLLEYLAGEKDVPPSGFTVARSNCLFWGIWWGILVMIILVFSGQSSKFIYIDF
jgi:hypothetical protein